MALNLALALRMDALGNNPAGFILPGSSTDLNFASGQYYPSTLPNSISTSRASNGYAQNADGSLTNFGANVPRIGIGTGLLVEQASTNLLLWSNDATQSGTWTPTNSVVASNVSAGPDLTQSAGTLTDNTTSASHSIAQTVAGFTSGTTYTASVYLKAGTATVAQITFATAAFSGAGYANFNLVAGTVAATGGTLAASGIQPLINGWYRCWISAVATATATANIALGLTNNSTSATRGPSYVGTGQTLSDFGFQLEALAFPTSYTPTTTSAAARAADVITLQAGVTTSISVTPVTVVTRTTSLQPNGRVVSFSGGALLVLNSTGPFMGDGTNSTNPAYGSGSISGLVKAAFRGTSSSMSAVGNFGIVGIIANPWANNTGTVTLGSTGGVNWINGYLARLTVVPQAVTDNQLQNYTQ